MRPMEPANRQPPFHEPVRLIATRRNDLKLLAYPPGNRLVTDDLFRLNGFPAELIVPPSSDRTD